MYFNKIQEIRYLQSNDRLNYEKQNAEYGWSDRLRTAQDQLMRSGYGVDVTERMFSDKLRFSRASLDNLLGMMGERERIRDWNLEAINYTSCKVGSYILQLQPFGDASCVIDPIRKSNLEKELVQLEQDKRREITGCWKDTVLLAKDAMEGMGKYQNIARNQELLNEPTGSEVKK